MTNQLTRDDVKRLSAEGKYHEIVQAQADGRLSDLLSGGKPAADSTTGPTPAPAREPIGHVTRDDLNWH